MIVSTATGRSDRAEDDCSTNRDEPYMVYPPLSREYGAFDSRDRVYDECMREGGRGDRLHQSELKAGRYQCQARTASVFQDSELANRTIQTSTNNSYVMITRDLYLSSPPSYCSSSMASTSLPSNVHVSTHPCVRAKLSQLRSKETNARDTKALVHEIALLVGCDALAACLQNVPTGTVSL